MAKMRALQVARAGGPLELVERDVAEPARGGTTLRHMGKVPQVVW